MNHSNWQHTKIIDHRYMNGVAMLNYDGLSADADSVSVISKDVPEMDGIIDHLVVSRKFHECGRWMEFGVHVVDLTRTNFITTPEMKARIRGCLQKWREDREGT